MCKCVAFLALALPAVASAQTTPSDRDSKTFAVTGTVPALCSTGSVVAGEGSFALGVLSDTTTGRLRTDLAAPARTLSGAFCSTRSTITVTATPMAAVNYTAAPPAGFSRLVDYTATATGWTASPASFSTAAVANPSAVQLRDGAFTGDITVSVGGFAITGAAAQRLVADTEYRGTVTVTLAAAN